MILPTLDYEKKAREEGYEIIIGIDEAGRGPLAGPVVAGAVFIEPKKINVLDSILTPEEIKLIRDSKTLSPSQRDKAFEIVTKNFHYGIGVCDHKTIDRINILQAAYLAMKGATTQLKSKINIQHRVSDNEYLILVDGNKKIPNWSYHQKAIVNGDRFSFSVAAASIVAKVSRDQIMMDFHEKYPAYGFDKHKGYGTRAHLEALETHGPCPIHRLSFNRVKI